jgi:hypothetical protein
MRKHLLIIAFIMAGCFSTNAQDKQSLEVAALQMYNNTVAGNYEAVASGTYPKIFEVLPKDKMMESLKAMLNGDGYTLMLLKADPKFEYGPIKKVNDGLYCLVKHDLLMKMSFKEPVSEVESKQMTENFKKAMQTNDITFESKSNSFTIKKRADVVFAADKFTKNQWKYMNRAGIKLMEKMFGPEVLKQLDIK